MCLLALGELIWRGRGLSITFAVGHIGATLIVAVGLVAAVETGWLPFSVARASDVGGQLWRGVCAGRPDRIDTVALAAGLDRLVARHRVGGGP